MAVGGNTHYDPGDGGPGAVRIVNRDGTAVTAGGGGGTSMTDDAAFTPGVSSVTPMGALADEVAADAVDEGDVGAVRMTTTRALHVNIRDDAGDSAMDGTNNAVRVNVVAGSGAGTEYTEDAAAAANPSGGALIAVRADTLGAVTDTDGDNLALRATNKGELYVKQSDSVPATGAIAHDAADSGNPIKVGGYAETSVSGRTMVADGDRTDAVFGVDGVQIVRENTNLEDIVSGAAAITDGSSTSVIAAQGVGIKSYITDVIIANSSVTPVTVDLRDGAAGTVKATYPAPGDTSGVVHSLRTPLPFSANTAVCADPSAAASTVTVTLIGFKSKI